jgi:glutamyl-tRNA reductase
MATRSEDAIVDRLSDVSGISQAELESVVYRKQDREAVEHLLRVACGLDSQVLGETQVLGQISQCFEAARTEETLGPLLTTLLSRAVHAGRRARRETDISLGKTSISHVAAALVDTELGGISGKQVVIVGAGETAAKAMRALYSCGSPRVVCLNRSAAKAEAMVGGTDAEVLPWPSLARTLTTCDAVITATSAPHPIIYPEDLATILAGRGGRPLVLVDIAVPRDVDPGVRELRGVVLYDIDQLAASLDEGRAGREAAVPRVEEIISEEADAIMDWVQSREVVPLVQRIRDKALAVADEEARRTIRKLGGLDERQQEIVSTMARQIANKIVHEPTVRLKARLRETSDDTYPEVVADIFGLAARVDDHK